MEIKESCKGSSSGIAVAGVVRARNADENTRTLGLGLHQTVRYARTVQETKWLGLCGRARVTVSLLATTC